MIARIDIDEDILNEKTEIGLSTVTVYGNIKDVNRVANYARHMYDEPTITDNSHADKIKEENMIDHPTHYNNGGMECIDEMILLYGVEETMSFCKLNAHKYRKRALDKGGRTDLEKSDWYLAKYKELKDSNKKPNVVSSVTREYYSDKNNN